MRASLLFIFLFFTKALQGQPHLFKTFSTHEGLSNNNVTCFVKDKQGFLWVGTQNGLNRFDGNAFDHFYNNPGDSNSIASNEIQTLYRDSKDRIWIGTAAGISVLEPGQKKFLNYAPDTLVLPRIGQFFAAIQEDHQGKIWTGCSYDLLIFDPLTQTFASSGWMKFAATVKPAKGNHTRIAVISIQPKSTDEFWVLTTYGLFSVHTSSRQFRYYPCDLSDDFYGSSISYIDPAGKLWIGTYDHDIISFDPAKNEWQQINIPASLRDERGLHIAYGIQPYHNDTLIFCSDKKLLLYHPASSTFSLFKQDGNKNIPDTYFFQIMRDGQHYWMAATSGLVSMQEKKTVFTYHTTPGLTQTYRVFNRPGFPQVYMGNFADRIVNINTITGQATPLLLGNKPVREGLRYYTSYNTDTGFISTGDHLYLLQQQKMSLHEITLPPKKFPDNDYSVRNLVTDREGIAWLRLSSQGICRYEPRSGIIAFMDFIPAASEKEYAYLYYDSLTHSLVTAVYNEGIYIYDINRRQTRHLLLNLHPSQRGAAIANICGNNKGTIYLADINNGLYRINLLVNDTVKRYTSLQGLPGNICYWCTTDNAGYVWIATPTGVCRMDPEKETFTDFGIDQGHPGNASFLSADQSGNIYQPWMDGYYSWNTSSFQADPPRGKIYLRNCMMNDTALPEDSVYHFAAGENNLSFQFGYLLLSENSTVDLEYRINNAAWLQLPENHAVAFSSLAPGNYHIQVREKKFPDAIFHLRFTIRTPVWARWWFIVLSGMLITAAVYYLFRRRLNTIRKENALKQKIAATEMMALRAQMNPHFIFNCISSIDNFILGNDKENASHYLNQFAKLIRNILDNSKNDVIPFWKDWETLSFYLEIEKLRNNNSFICKMEADESLLNGHYKIPPLVIQPYIENAIHHGLRALKNRQGILTITAKLREGILEYRIEDNGIGREQAAASRYMHVTHQSYGMQLSRERIELFNDQSGNSVTITDLKDDKGEASGTLVVVLLKV